MRYRDRIPTGLNSYTVCIPTIPTCSNTVPKPDPIPTGLNYYKSAAYPLLQVPYTGLIQCMAHRQCCYITRLYYVYRRTCSIYHNWPYFHDLGFLQKRGTHFLCGHTHSLAMVVSTVLG